MRFERIWRTELRSQDTVPIMRELGCPVIATGSYVNIDESGTRYKSDEIISRMAKHGYKPVLDPAPTV